MNGLQKSINCTKCPVLPWFWEFPVFCCPACVRTSQLAATRMRTPSKLGLSTSGLIKVIMHTCIFQIYKRQSICSYLEDLSIPKGSIYWYIIYTYNWLMICSKCIVNAQGNIPCIDPMGYKQGMIQLDFPPHCGILGIVYLQSLKAKKIQKIPLKLNMGYYGNPLCQMIPQNQTCLRKNPFCPASGLSQI